MPFPADLPGAGTEPGSPALQELSGKPNIFVGNVITILTSSLIINLFSLSVY